MGAGMGEGEADIGGGPAGGEAAAGPAGAAPEPLTRDEQQAVALDWLSAMWTEALKRGVSPETLVEVVLTAAFSEVIRLYGRDAAVALAEKIPPQIRDLPGAEPPPPPAG